MRVRSATMMVAACIYHCLVSRSSCNWCGTSLIAFLGMCVEVWTKYLFPSSFDGFLLKVLFSCSRFYRRFLSRLLPVWYDCRRLWFRFNSGPCLLLLLYRGCFVLHLCTHVSGIRPACEYSVPGGLLHTHYPSSLALPSTTIQSNLHYGGLFCFVLSRVLCFRGRPVEGAQPRGKGDRSQLPLRDGRRPLRPKQRRQGRELRAQVGTCVGLHELF